jgi:hypothetical protein
MKIEITLYCTDCQSEKIKKNGKKSSKFLQKKDWCLKKLLYFCVYV